MAAGWGTDGTHHGGVTTGDGDPRLGSLVGVVGGLVFVLVNAGALPGALVWRVLAVAAAVVVVALLATRPVAGAGPPSREALRTYLVSVGLMVVAIPVGAAVLGALGEERLVLPWVVVVVGAHFVPFASAFAAPVFRLLGLALVAIGAVGAVAALAGAGDAPEATGVAAGSALLAAAAAPLLRRR